jgi:glucokinase
VGGAAIVDGRLLKGRSGKAGHLGHICLNVSGQPDVCGVPGSLEVMMGNCTIETRSQGRFATTHDLIKAHLKGDVEATRIWMESVRALACAIGSYTNILDPEAVIIGGGIARAGEVLFGPLKELVPEVEWKVCGHQVEILPAQLGELAGAYGAAWQGFHPLS